MVTKYKQEYVTLSREELYHLVWTEPFTSLSKRFKISDVGLRKKCLKYEIPIPNAGYWRKVETNNLFGFNKPTLCLESFGLKDSIKLPIRTKESNVFDEKKKELDELFLKHKSALEYYPGCHVSMRFSKPHYLVAIALTYYRKILSNKTREKSELITQLKPVLHLNVEKKNVERALLILDTFLKMLDQVGYRIEVRKYAFKIFSAKVVFGFSIIEKRKILSRSPWILVPTGVLSFKLNDKEWIETDDKKLEAYIPEILAHLVRARHQ